jgi:hypothetical protein
MTSSRRHARGLVIQAGGFVSHRITPLFDTPVMATISSYV